MSGNIYNDRFFNSMTEPSRRSAFAVTPIVMGLVQPKTVVDIGCAEGIWLSAFKEIGKTEIFGLDGDYVDRQKLQIPQSCFQALDLANPIPIDRKFDLAISLEVAEHLPPNSADKFVDFITSLASVVFFSAAVPGQGGRNHLNEQWPEYWSKLFADRGFQAFDVIRPKIWNMKEVEPWYAQNSFIYIDKDKAGQYPKIISDALNTKEMPYNLVHPELFRRFSTLEYIHGAQMVKELAARLKRRVFKKDQVL